MANTVDIYTSGLMALLSQADLSAAKVVPLKAAYTFDATEDYYSDISAQAVSSGSVALANLAVSTDDTNLLAKIDADDLTTTIAEAFQHLVFFIDTGNVATSPLLFCWTFDAEQIVGTYNFQWNADGIAVLSAGGFGT